MCCLSHYWLKSLTVHMPNDVNFLQRTSHQPPLRVLRSSSPVSHRVHFDLKNGEHKALSWPLEVDTQLEVLPRVSNKIFFFLYFFFLSFSSPVFNFGHEICGHVVLCRIVWGFFRVSIEHVDGHMCVCVCISGRDCKDFLSCTYIGALRKIYWDWCISE